MGNIDRIVRVVVALLVAILIVTNVFGHLGLNRRYSSSGLSCHQRHWFLPILSAVPHQNPLKRESHGS